MVTAILSIKTTNSSKQGIHKADIREERDAIPVRIYLPIYNSTLKLSLAAIFSKLCCWKIFTLQLATARKRPTYLIATTKGPRIWDRKSESIQRDDRSALLANRLFSSTPPYLPCSLASASDSARDSDRNVFASFHF